MRPACGKECGKEEGALSDTVTRRIRTLVADDSAQARSAISRFLQTIPEIDLVAIASNGNDAVVQAEGSKPDLILMDLQMPGMNGLEVVKMLRERNLMMRVIMITLHDSPEIEAQCKESGVDGFVAKSKLAHELPREIGRIFNGSMT